MRYLIISDIHSNLSAFEAVLAEAEGAYDFVWCLGDVVGYGPDPEECVARLQALPHLTIAGNHDWAALDKLDLLDFNAEARTAVRWTRQHLTGKEIRFLESLPERPEPVDGRFTLVHGSPRHPIWEYVVNPTVAQPNFDYFATQFCFLGHTHVPVIFRYRPENNFCEQFFPPLDEPLPLGGDRLIINPGSVGQPRDGDPRASYAILDTDRDTLEFHRLPYPVEVTQHKMLQAGLPPRLFLRLAYGW